MRLLLLAALVVLALPVRAQARFVDACVASSDSDEALPFEPGPVCQCAADAVMATGVAAADLDAVIDYVDENQQMDMAAMPEASQGIASAAMESLLSCALAANPDALSVAPPADPTIVSTAAPEAPAPVAPAPVARPSTPPPTPPSGGVRLGGGAAPQQAVQSGPGSAIRIVN